MSWISTKDRLPNSYEDIVLAYVDNKILMGSFRAIEWWNVAEDGSKKDYRKKISFSPFILLNKHRYEKDCADDDLCEDCSNYHIELLIPSFGLEKVTHWMPLPSSPGVINEQRKIDNP